MRHFISLAAIYFCLQLSISRAFVPFHVRTLLEKRREIETLPPVSPNSPPQSRLRNEALSRHEFLISSDDSVTYLTGRKETKTVAGPRIVGGSDALDSQFQFIVSIQNIHGHFCGGSLVKSDMILTAAHCVTSETSITDASSIFVEVGRHTLGLQAEVGYSRVKVEEVIVHACYNGSEDMSYDIALLTLKENVTDIPLVELHSNIDSTFTPGSSSVSVAGWGNTQLNMDDINDPVNWPNVLQHVSYPTISNAACTDYYKVNDNIVTPAMICAMEEGGGKDSCQGDSGGPLIFNPPGTQKQIQVGVVSWGVGCALDGYPGVYADVAKVHDWILGYVMGLDMNKQEREKGDSACPFRFVSGLPGGINGTKPWQPETLYIDCSGVGFGAEYLAWKGDCYCDNEASEYGLNLNCEEWDWDEGDCWANSTLLSQCNNSTNGGNSNCTSYSCLDSTFCVEDILNWMGDNYCDSHLNCEAYDMDGGDCEYANLELVDCAGTTFESTHLDWLADCYCDNATTSAVNFDCAEWGWDGGDCWDNSTSLPQCNVDNICIRPSCTNENICVDQIYDSWFGDDYCDQSLNCEANGWDDGDCAEYDSDGGSGEGGEVVVEEEGCVQVSLDAMCINENMVLKYYVGDECGGDADIELTIFGGVELEFGERYMAFGECLQASNYMSTLVQGTNLENKYVTMSCENGQIMSNFWFDSSCSTALTSVSSFDEVCAVKTNCKDGSGSLPHSPFWFLEGYYVEGYCEGSDDVVLTAYGGMMNCMSRLRPMYKIEHKVGSGWGYMGDEGGEGQCKALEKDTVREDINLLYNPGGWHHVLQCEGDGGLAYDVYETEETCEREEEAVLEKDWDGKGNGRCKMFEYQDEIFEGGARGGKIGWSWVCMTVLVYGVMSVGF